MTATLPPDPPPPARCPDCGSEWFVLRMKVTEGERRGVRFVGGDQGEGVICMDETGGVTGWGGWPACAECGRTYPMRGRLPGGGRGVMEGGEVRPLLAPVGEDGDVPDAMVGVPEHAKPEKPPPLRAVPDPEKESP